MAAEGPRPLRGVELHVLLSVVDRARHGYAILLEAEERTGGHPGFEIPTLYRALRRLRDEGLIAVSGEAPDGKRGESYEATAAGRAALRAELARLKVVLAVGYARLEHAGPAGGE